MKALLIEEAQYNGLFFSSRKITPREVTILGVMKPVDPGMVTILDNKEQRQVPTFALKDCPNIDFGKMLNQHQIKVRYKCGMLIGNGLGMSPKQLVPIDKCPVK